jgi:predicted nucleic-acid-binding Zn-ribbon protein
MEAPKKCPKCRSSRIHGNVIIEDGKRFFVIGCKKCGFFNKRIIDK